MMFLGLALFIAAGAQEVEKETFLYSVKGTDSLYLDKYDGIGQQELKPCVIFIHGGHFSSGDRGDGIGYFKYLARNGYTVVSISYRLGFKGVDVKNAQVYDLAQMEKLLSGTIDMAVEDLFDATGFILANAAEWKVDPKMIIASGTSAGAITVLQSEYYICNGHRFAAKLPAGFNYAGICAFAGAIYSPDDITWAKKPCPIMMFHGNADDTVPYDALRLPANGGFFGSKYIAATLRAQQSPYLFYTVVDTAHEVAWYKTIVELREDVIYFYRVLSLNRNPMMIDTEVRIVGRPERKKTFTMEDFIRSTFGESK